MNRFLLHLPLMRIYPRKILILLIRSYPTDRVLHKSFLFIAGFLIDGLPRIISTYIFFYSRNSELRIEILRFELIKKNKIRGGGNIISNEIKEDNDHREIRALFHRYQYERHKLIQISNILIGPMIPL